MAPPQPTNLDLLRAMSAMEARLNAKIDAMKAELVEDIAEVYDLLNARLSRIEAAE